MILLTPQQIRQGLAWLVAEVVLKPLEQFDSVAGRAKFAQSAPLPPAAWRLGRAEPQRWQI
jgi:hypothetical protein